MPLIGSVSGSAGYGRGSSVGKPRFITPAGSLGTLNDNQRANTFTVEADPGPGAVSVTYAVSSGSLPSGATLNTNTGVISGFSAVADNTTSTFEITATNNAGTSLVETFSITINAVTITFSSPAAGSRGTFRTGDSFNTTYSASASSGSISYSRSAGTLPSGTSLNSNGSHTGTISGSSTTASWTIRAQTVSGSVTKTVDRSFSAVIDADLYSFSSLTFGTAGQTGRSGPSLAQIRSSYSSQSWTQNSAYLNMSVQGCQEWTVPRTGTYRFDAAGAAGSGYNSGSAEGSGARIRADFQLTKNQVIIIAVGQRGINQGGGGGGTFVARRNSPTSYTPLLIAGGAGARDNRYGAEGANHHDCNPASTSGKPGGRGGGGPAGGTNGNGGTGGGGGGGAGGGWFNNGSRGQSGLGFLQGGSTLTTNALLGGPNNPGPGGFGGGGSTSDDQAAGGGGYSGGGGSDEDQHGGAAGSYVDGSGSNRVNQSNNAGQGFCAVTRIS